MSVTVKTPHGDRKLGRIRPKARPQCLRFAAYYDKSKDVSPPPTSVDYSAKASASLSRMYLNDTYGDCVIAGKGHNLGIWTGNESGTAAVATDQEIYQQYQTICGPGDNGCVITDVLDYVKAHGFTAAGKKYPIDGYVSIDFTNKLEVQVATDLFGALTIGINLPNAWTNSGPGVVWDTTNSQIVGGHDVTIYGYNEQGVLISTWGSVGTVLTWAALANNGVWVEEMYAILSPDWTSNANLAPNGVDAATLAADLAKLGGGTIPPIDPTPIPGPTPVPPGPAAFPNYSGTATLTTHLPFLGTVTLTGPVALSPASTEPKKALSFLTVIEDAFAIFVAYQSGNGAALIAAVQKLLTDLGLNLLPPACPENYHAPAGVTLQTILADVLAIFQGVKDGSFAEVEAAFQKLLADVGL